MSNSLYRYGLTALAVVFFLLCLPLLSKVSRWRGDERFYTDASIGMMQSGNYFTPTYSDGTARFKKPILTYWVVLLSYKTMGINYLASRLPFLLAGTLVVVLTYRLALILIRRRPEALVAAAIMASNLPVLYLSIRSTPDILLTLFILISMIGFANLIFRGHRSAANYCLAYLGVALAVATKGLFGLLPVLFVVGFVLIARPPGMRWRELLHGPALFVALPVALFWFFLVFTQHGTAAVSDFLGDQVGDRFSGSKWYVLSNASVYFSSFVLLLLPWSAGALVFLYQARRQGIALFPQHRREILFMGAWILFLYGVFIFGNIQRTRYFLPAYPQLAILVALLLCAGFRNTAAKLHLKRLFLSLGWLFVTAGIVLILAGCRIHFCLLVSGVMITLLSLLLISRFNRWAPSFFMAGFAGLIMAISAVWDIGVRPLFFISAAPEMTQQILVHYPGGTPVAMIGIPQNYESQVRVLSRGLVKPAHLPDTSTQDEIGKFPILICAKHEYDQGKRGAGKVIGYAAGLGGWRAKDFLHILASGKKDAVWASRREEYYLVRP